MKDWEQAIDDALVNRFIGVFDRNDSYQEASRKLNEIIDFEVQVATDPRVNGGYELRHVSEKGNNMSKENIQNAIMLCKYATHLLDNAFYDHLKQADEEAANWIMEFMNEMWKKTHGELRLSECFAIARSFWESGEYQKMTPQDAVAEEISYSID